ncbi:MAG: HAD-IA family hydrolase [Saprospiraceae bacterium]|nr:HAD-IA family hydrolase [Saprospiraceae bacterium]
MTVIFDFDGTLANTLDTFIEIYNTYIVKEFKCKPFDKSRLSEFQSKPPKEFMSDFGVTLWKLPFIALRARNLLIKQMPNVEPFQGILELTHQLQPYFNIGIVSSNSEKNVRLFLNKHQISSLFQFVNGGQSMMSKQKALERVIKKHELKKSEIIYVGDEIRDIESCKLVGIACVAVTWGHQKRDLLQGYQPDALVDNPNELWNYLLQWKQKITNA